MKQTLCQTVALVLLSGWGVGCTPYWLVCDAQVAAVERKIGFYDLRDSVATAARDLGYEIAHTDERTKFKDAEFHQTGRMSPSLAVLKGAKARVDLGVGGWNGNMITIQDFDNRQETEFVRALRERIQTQLETDFGVNHECFKRQWSPFAP